MIVGTSHQQNWSKERFNDGVTASAVFKITYTST
jgi:hypothetical protein